MLSDDDSYGAAPESDSDSEVEVTAVHVATVEEAALSVDDATNEDSNDEDSSAPEMDGWSLVKNQMTWLRRSQ